MAGALFALLLLLLIVTIIALPASLVTRLLPPGVTASDFSGGLWHGAAGHLLINGRDCGAVEWRLHPGALTGLALGVDATWAMGAFSLTATGRVTAHGVMATAIHGGGALEDIATLTGMNGWRGTATVALDGLDADFGQLRALAGEITTSGLRNPTVGGGDDLGGYTLRFAPGSAGADGLITGQLRDTGGPLDVAATLQLDGRTHMGTLHGTARERDQASATLRRSLEQLALMSPRDSAGRVPLDVEFAY